MFEEPVVGILVAFGVVATVNAMTKRQDVPGDSSGIIGAFIGDRYPVVTSGGVRGKQVFQLPTTDRTATMPVFKRKLPIVFCEAVRQISEGIAPFEL